MRIVIPFLVLSLLLSAALGAAPRWEPKRISLAVFPSDWSGDGVKDGLVWGAVFRDEGDRAMRFSDRPCRLDLRLRALTPEGRPGELLLERKGLTIRAHDELNALYPRHDWQRIAWSDVRADAKRHARQGRLELSVTLPSGKILHDAEQFKTVLFPRSAVLPNTPHIEIMTTPSRTVHDGSAPELDRVRLFASAVDENRDGRKEGIVWWLAFRNETGDPVRFRNLPYTVDLVLRARNGRILHEVKGLKGTSHRSFPLLFPGAAQKLAAEVFRGEKEGRLEATIRLGKERYHAVEGDFVALHR